jgi:hypothetical protein
MKKLFNLLTIVLVSSIIFSSCKGEKGDVGPQGSSGPSASKYSFTLTFDNATTFKNYSGLQGKVSANDVVLIYALYNTYSPGNDYYTQLPVTVSPAYIFAEINYSTGNVIIDAIKSDGTSGSPFASNTDVQFQAVIIKGGAGARMAKGPDYKNYNEVIAYYNLN